jgi:hypothetical protein
MKKLFIIAAFAMFLTGCGVGTYSVQSGVADAAFISFTDDVKQEIVVSVDNKTYNIETVRQKAYKSGRDIKRTALNTIKLTPGQHVISVTLDGKEIYSHKVFLSAGETKIVEL